MSRAPVSWPTAGVTPEPDPAPEPRAASTSRAAKPRPLKAVVISCVLAPWALNCSIIFWRTGETPSVIVARPASSKSAMLGRLRLLVEQPGPLLVEDHEAGRLDPAEVRHGQPQRAPAVELAEVHD